MLDWFFKAVYVAIQECEEGVVHMKYGIKFTSMAVALVAILVIGGTSIAQNNSTVPGVDKTSIQGVSDSIGISKVAAIIIPGTVDVRDFGAHSITEPGYEAFNSTDAFAAASAAINAAGGGTLVLPANSIFIVGKQTLAGAKGKGYSYLPSKIIYIEDCTNKVVIEGNGSVLRTAPGLKFGSFDPITGLKSDHALPWTNQDNRADAYKGGMVYSQNNVSFEVKDLEMDGNIANIDLGGQWGDTGYQCGGTGLKMINTKNIIATNIYTHHNPLDGLSIWTDSLTATDEKTPAVLTNVTSEYNARQGMSWSGGIGLTATNCKFNHTGKAAFHSSPGAGLDIEAQNSVVRDGLFINCEFINNSGAGVVADSGDGGYTTFQNCTIWGTTNRALWPQKPFMRFEDCNIYGSVVNTWGSSNPAEATQFIRCNFEDKPHPLYGIYNSGYLLDIGGDNVLFDGCTVINNTRRAIITNGVAGTVEKFKNCNFIFRWSATHDKEQQAIFRTSYLENVTFSDEIATPTPNGSFINVISCTIGQGVVVNGPTVKWKSWSPGAGGMLGTVPPTI